MAEYSLHNVRFYEYYPEAIHCLAYNNCSNLLALSRADGSIEIWDCVHKPFKKNTLIGQHGSSVEALVWYNDVLFSAGLNGFISSYRIPTFSLQEQIAVMGGPTWCLALSPNKQFLAAGTEGGYVCIFEISNEKLNFNNTVARQKNRILSIGWHPDNDRIVTGSINHVQVTSCKTGQSLHFPVSLESSQKEIIVWCVTILQDMTIITGDSRGFLCFWDGSFGTSINRMQTHRADILTMQLKPNMKSIYVSGVDPMIVEVSLVESQGVDTTHKRWVKSAHYKIHSHDVRALAITHESKLFSGGVDTYLMLSYYPPKTFLKYPATPPRGYTGFAKQCHCVLLGYKNKIELWKLGQSSPPIEDTYPFLEIAKDKRKLLEIELKERDRLEFCAVSPNAKRVAYLVQGKLKVFSLDIQKKKEHCQLKKLRGKDDKLFSSYMIHWLDDQLLVSLNPSNHVQVLDTSDEEVSLKTVISTSLESRVREMASSNDGCTLALLDYNKFISVFYSKKKDWVTLNTIKSNIPISSFAINDDHIFIAYSNISVAEYNFRTEEFTSFAKMLNKSLIDASSNAFHNISYINPDMVSMHSLSNFFILKRDVELSQKTENKENEFRNDGSYHVITKSSGLISTLKRPNILSHFSHLSNNTLVSIEINPIMLRDNLPPALKPILFGAR